MAFLYKKRELLLSKASKQLQPLIKGCSDLMNLKLSADISTICRRVIVACFNGGIPCTLLSELESKLDSSQYDDIDLPNLYIFIPDLAREGVEPAEMGELGRILRHPISNFYNQIFKDASEAQYRVMFWDSILTHLYDHQASKNLVDNSVFRIEAEWNIRRQFPALESRKVDFVALWADIPLMIIEMGNKEFGLGVHSHKDSSKSITMMSHAGRNLAKKLENMGKGAEQAQVFGIWIGGTQLQFITGKMIVTEIGDKNYLHCNVYFGPELKFDAVTTSTVPEQSTAVQETLNVPVAEEAPAPVSSSIESSNESSSEAPTSPSRKSTPNEAFYSVPSSPIILESQLATPMIPTGFIEMDVPPSSSVSPEAHDDNQSEDVVILLESDEEDEKEESEVIIDPRVKIEGEIDMKTLVYLDRFICECVKYMKSIEDLPNVRTNIREFQEPGQVGFIPESRKSAYSDTPSGAQLTGAGNKRSATTTTSNLSKNPKNRKSNLEYYDDYYTCERRSPDELEVYKMHLSGSFGFFPEMVEYFTSEDDEERFDIVLEKMDPFIIKSFNSAWISEHLSYASSREALVKTLKFAIELLNNLDYLHTVCHHVHADISPNNIMYSIKYGIWKFIDYENSMGITASKMTRREAGTIGFISPESLETGIFTEASDVFALGNVIHETLYYKLIERFEMRSRRNNDQLYDLFVKFENVLLEMRQSNPMERISVRDSLLQLFGILVKIPESFDIDQPVYLRVSSLFENAQKIKKLEQQLKETSISEAVNIPKKIRHETEEEQSIIKSAPLF